MKRKILKTGEMCELLPEDARGHSVRKQKNPWNYYDLCSCKLASRSVCSPEVNFFHYKMTYLTLSFLWHSFSYDSFSGQTIDEDLTKIFPFSLPTSCLVPIYIFFLCLANVVEQQRLFEGIIKIEWNELHYIALFQL